LSQRIYWLIQLRWLASSAVIYGTFVAANLIGVRMDPIPLYIIGGAIAVYNSFFIIAVKWSEVNSSDGRPRHARSIANGQIVVDLLFLTLLIHFSGGVENPISFYFIFHIIIASILLSRGETFLQATLANGLFGGMVLGEFTGIIPHLHLLGPGRPDLAEDGLFVGSTLLVFCSTLYLAAYMATSIVSRLRARDRENLELTAKLEAKALELEEAYNRLAEVERIKSQYMRKVSHEIKAPVLAMQSSLTAVLEGVAGEVPPRQREMIARAEKRGQAMLGLVSDLLVLSRVRDARLFTQRKLVSPAKVAEKMAAVHMPRATSKGVDFSTRVQRDVPTIFADPEALEQLVSNLVSNAINYTPRGGKVELEIWAAAGTLTLRVSDTGIGISSSDLPRIFNEFFRAENARRFSEEGTGLGLSIVRSIVDTMGGDISVESQVGTGSTFTVVLPIDGAPTVELEGEHPEQPTDDGDESAAASAPH